MARVKSQSPVRRIGTGNSMGKVIRRRRLGAEGITRIMRQKRKNKAGQAALKEIKKLQRDTKTVIPKASFSRMVREIMFDFKSDIRMQSTAMLALQEASEDYLVNLFSKCQVAAIHAGRATVEPRDMYLTRYLRDDHQPSISKGEDRFRATAESYQWTQVHKMLPSNRPMEDCIERRWEQWEKQSRANYRSYGFEGTFYDDRPRSSLRSPARSPG